MRRVSTRGIEDSLRLIAEQIEKGKSNALAHQVASAVLSQRAGARWAIPIGDERRELAALLAWVRANVRYQHDPAYLDTFQSAERTIQLARGDCDDMTILLGALAQNAGYPVALRIVDLGSGEWEHIYPLVGIPAEDPRTWLALDATVSGGLGWEAPSGRIVRQATHEVRDGKLRPFLGSLAGLAGADGGTGGALVAVGVLLVALKVLGAW